ncbi:MAG: ankyrin repeat domain-containing protein [Methylophilaceae bacterium]
MQWIKTALLAMALCLPFNASAMTDVDEEIWREAVINGEMETVQKFVKADPGVVNDKIFGWSPLQMAANTNQLATVKYLIDNGAELDYLQPNALHTSFHLAAFNRMTDMTTLLAKAGADVNIKLRNNFSLIQFFREEGDPEMMKHLTSLGVKDDGCKGEYC